MEIINSSHVFLENGDIHYWLVAHRAFQSQYYIIKLKNAESQTHQTKKKQQQKKKQETSENIVASENIVDVLTEYEDGALIYSCSINGKTKIAKYKGMKLWLMENGSPVGMMKMLDGLHWVLELSTVEQAFRLKDSVRL